MYTVCLRYAAFPDDAQDLLQEGFVKVFKSLAGFRNEGSFEGWIRRIMVHTAIEHFRKKKMITPLSVVQELEHQEDGNAVFSAMGTKEILEMIAQLPDGYRTVFNLHVIEGHPHKEIAQLLGISEGTSKSQLARAKQYLQDLIKSKNR